MHWIRSITNCTIDTLNVTMETKSYHGTDGLKLSTTVLKKAQSKPGKEKRQCIHSEMDINASVLYALGSNITIDPVWLAVNFAR